MKLDRLLDRKLEAKARRGVCSIDIDAPDPPAPDPQIGAAAVQNVELGREMAQIAREELQYRRERDARLEPMFKDTMDRAARIAEDNAKRSSEAWERYKTAGIPAEDEYIKAAREIGGEADQARAAGRAVADVDTQFDISDEMHRREMARAGINPSEGANVVGRRLALLGRAAGRSGAATRAREQQRLLGLSAKEGVAKFVRGMPSQGLAADAAALGAGSASTAAAGTQAGIHNAGVAGVGTLMGGAGSLGASGGNLLLGQHRAALEGYQTGLQYESDMYGALGTAAGSMFGAWMGKKAKGGIIRAPRVLRYSLGGKIKSVFDFEKHAGNRRLSLIKKDPERVFIGAVDPASSKMWGKVTGKDYEPLVDQWGGASKESYASAEAEGIDIKPGKRMHQLARLIAAYYVGGYAADKLGLLGGGAESAGAAEGGAAPSAGAATETGATSGSSAASGSSSSTASTPWWQQIPTGGGGSQGDGGSGGGRESMSGDDQEELIERLEQMQPDELERIWQTMQAQSGQGGAPLMMGFVTGGKVRGPGGPTDDEVPAVVDGKFPAALSDGEFVVKASSTRQYGEKLLNDVNAGKAEIIPAEVVEKIGGPQRVRTLVMAAAKRQPRAPVTLEMGR